MKDACNKAVFIDRDGVITIEPTGKGKNQYIRSLSEMKIQMEIVPLLQTFQRLGYKLIVVTNQACISKGYLSHRQFAILTRYMIAQLRRKGIRIANVYYCSSCNPHHPCRKPNPGMLWKAKQRYHIDLQKSILIGNQLRDIKAGKRAGIGMTILYDSNAMPDITVKKLSYIQPGNLKRMKGEP